MKLRCDLHIHTALSPCGDSDMTPNNIVNMSLLNETDVIAITDHNTVGNVQAVMDAAKNTDLLVIPGMEIETAEEIHVVALFPDMETAREMERLVKQSLPKIKNRAKIFGNQYFMDSEDNITGEEEQLLLTATGMTIYDVIAEVKRLGGAAIPAHIDRGSYSVTSSLGSVPLDLGVKYVEFSKKADIDSFFTQYPSVPVNFRYYSASDSHYLEDLNVVKNLMDFPEKCTKTIVEKLC